MLERIKRILARGKEAAQAARAPEAQAQVEGENILMISDLHLGEACKEHSRIEYLKRAAEFDAHICAFLEHAMEHRPGGRPWRLILGGDLFDFLQVTLVPEGASEELRTYGLGTREDESVWKLGRLMDRHRTVFVYLAAFIGAGNRIEVVQGNHDEELFWPAVRTTLVQGLVQLYFGGEHGAGDTPEAFADRIRFNTWFYYQPGLVYVEHGHRFDEFCTTPPQLCPLRPQGEDELATPMSGLAIRYFANLERGFRTHDKEHWRVPDYVRYYRSRGSLWQAALNVGGRYVGLAKRAVRYHLDHARHQSERATSQHSSEAAALAERWGLTQEQIHTLDALGAPSVMANPLGIYAILGLGEISASIVLLLVSLVLLATSFGWIIDLGILTAVAIGGFSWARHVRRMFPTDIQRKLDEKAEAISQLLDVPVVVMGHCHRARRRRMTWNHRRFYVNTGNFIAPEVLRHAKGEKCNCNSTYAELLDPGTKGPSPTIYRWCCVDEKPVVYEVVA
jgi:UDP-2,3-diacylglucosamine pyrophosphatase LpxH